MLNMGGMCLLGPKSTPLIFSPHLFISLLYLMPDTEKWFRITFLIVTENSYHDKALFHTFEFHTLNGKALFQ